MSATPKKKICWNCEGRVAFSDENCPYCGVYLSSSAMLNQQDQNNSHIAPYRPGSDKSIPASPFNIDKDEEESENEDSKKSLKEEALNTSQKSTLLPFLLLLGGSVFLIFSLILLIFSRQGTLTLQWNATYWFLYLGFSIFLLFSGWRSLQNLKS